MRPLKIYLCEDEDMQMKVNHLILTEHLSRKHIKAELICRSEYCQEDDEFLKTIDMAILDIDLGGNSGIELAKKIRILNSKSAVIFVTGHPEYSLEASQILLSGFLAKPIDPLVFEEIIDRALVQINGYRVSQMSSKTASFQNGKIVIKERSIISIEKIPNTHEVNIITRDEILTAYDTIKDIDKRISDLFIKVNVSVIVNMSYIKRIESRQVVLRDGRTYKISYRRKEKVEEAYEEFVRRMYV